MHPLITIGASSLHTVDGIKVSTYDKYYKLTDKPLDDIALSLTSEVGYAIAAATIILGTWLLGSGLFIYATRNPNDDMSKQTAIKKIAIGSLLITFTIVVGVIIITVKQSAG